MRRPRRSLSIIKSAVLTRVWHGPAQRPREGCRKQSYDTPLSVSSPALSAARVGASLVPVTVTTTILRREAAVVILDLHRIGQRYGFGDRQDNRNSDPGAENVQACEPVDAVGGNRSGSPQRPASRTGYFRRQGQYPPRRIHVTPVTVTSCASVMSASANLMEPLTAFASSKPLGAGDLGDRSRLLAAGDDDRIITAGDSNRERLDGATPP